ncbi:MAG: hypothetical protein ABEJ62_02880, partial [Candidatus Nanohaloarchaea archaeon]
MVLGKIRQLFGEREPVEVAGTDSIPEVYSREKQQELEQARERADELHREAGQALDELEEFLEDLEDYSDEKDRSIVEDVVDNVAGERLRMIQEHDLPEDPRELHDSLQRFIEEFNSLKQKEAAVLEEAHLGKELGNAIQDVQELQEEIDSFLEQDYRTVDTLEGLQDIADRREELRLDIDQLEMEKDEKQQQLEQKRQELKEVEQDVEDLTSSGRWNGYREQEEAVEELREELEGKEQEFRKAASRMERGMKKLVYQIENGDLEPVDRLEVLKTIRDGDHEKLLERDPHEIVDAVEEATGVLPTDLLESSTHEKFMDGAEYLMELTNRHSDLYQLRDEIERKKQELEGHPVREQKQGLEKQKRQLRRDIEELAEEIAALEEQVEQKRQELQEKGDDLREKLEASLDRPVEYVEDRR